MDETPGAPMEAKWIVSAESSWYEECAFMGHSQDPPAVKPNTRYHIRLTYRGDGITGPRDAAHPEHGLVVKMGGWQESCRDPYEPGVDPPFAQTTAVTEYGTTNGTWREIEGEWHSGSRTSLPLLYMALENVSSGRAYIDSIEMREMAGGTVADPILTGANLIDKYSPAALDYYAQKPSFLLDQIIESAEENDLYIRPVVLEKNEYLAGKTDAYGYPQFKDHVDNFYGATKRCTDTCREPNAQRWLTQAWFRYVQARWGYSTSIHSWELLNEGDPDHDGHFALADEMGKTFKCRVFGMQLSTEEGVKCRYEHPNAHSVSTSFWHGFPAQRFYNDPKYSNIDYADLHAYISTGYAPDSESQKMQEDAAYYHLWYSRDIRSRNMDMPVMRGEAGMDLYDSQNSDALGIQADTSGTWLHNFIWAGLHPGALIEQYWWVNQHIRYTFHGVDYDHRNQYQNFYRFIEDIPLNNGFYRDIHAQTSNERLRVVGQQDPRHGNAHLWIHNTQHTWKQVVDGHAIPAQSGTITLAGFVPARTYRVQWWETSAGEPTHGEAVTADATGAISITVANLETDTAVKIINAKPAQPNIDFMPLPIMLAQP